MQAACSIALPKAWKWPRPALDLGFYISFSGIVTFKSAQDLRDVAAYVPADRILIETDSPYLAPVPYRGQNQQSSLCAVCGPAGGAGAGYDRGSRGPDDQ